MLVLGIETSCDETAAAVVGDAGVLSDVVHSQAVHARYLGVVPELASRAHVERIVPVARRALAEAGIERPAAVAATSGPGLAGALLVGLCFAKALAIGWRVPFVAVNHLEGHVLSATLPGGGAAAHFPYLGLVVSGGHTALYLVRGAGSYQVLSRTVDDAAGEAFDKVARSLGLGYPGGPEIDRLAAGGRPDAVAFPRPRAGRMDMSFSGLKTAVRVRLAGGPALPAEDVAASFQAAVVDVLLDRVRRAAGATGVRCVAISGGVAANSGLRRAFAAAADLDAFFPPVSRCTDNAAMIAHAGRLRLLCGRSDPLSVPARARWELEGW